MCGAVRRTCIIEPQFEIPKDLKGICITTTIVYPAIAQLVERPTVVVKMVCSHRTVPGSNPGCRMFFIAAGDQS